MQGPDLSVILASNREIHNDAEAMTAHVEEGVTGPSNGLALHVGLHRCWILYTLERIHQGH